MNKYKEKSAINTYKGFIIRLLSHEPKSTAEILLQCKNRELYKVLEAFIQLKSQEKIEMIGFYSCNKTGIEAPHYIFLSGRLSSNRKNIFAR